MIVWLLFAAALAGQPPKAEFSQTYPARVRAFPALRAELDRRAAALRTEFVSDAAKDRREAVADKRVWRAWEMSRSWAVVTETPRFLSLSMELYVDSGGAHPNHGSQGLLWDKRAGRAMTALAVFTSPAAFNRVFRRPFCAALDRERSKRREGDIFPRGDMFNECIDPTRSTVILGSSNKRTIDRVGVLIDPYVAGPYVEGWYDVTLPVTPALLAVVRPQYRAAFSVQ